MCTVTWCRSRGAYELFFNRDERRARPDALSPRVQSAGAVRFLAPIDPQGGGTWLAVNDRGVAAGLLNLYEREAAAMPASPLSRGLLIPSLMASSSARDLASAAAAGGHAQFAPFVLVAVDPDFALQVRWDGRRVETAALEKRDLPVSTSSFDTAAVLARRRARWTELVGGGLASPAVLEAYHRSRDPAGGAYSVRMERQDARTVSISRIRVTPAAVAFRYEALAADGGSMEPQELELTRA